MRSSWKEVDDCSSFRRSHGEAPFWLFPQSMLYSKILRALWEATVRRRHPRLTG